jgi:outer membrane receptor protein involved in Fe transport
MKMCHLLGATALASSLIVAAPAFAQSTSSGSEIVQPAGAADLQQTEASADGSDAEGTVVVTGSRIRRPNVESPVPITTFGGEEFFRQGQTSVGDALNELPQLRTSVAQQTVGAGVGVAGLNLLDLRGLGTIRTLVLVNGRRHVPADILNNAASVDVGSISTDLIERVEIITGGSSAVYGSDAIAGVVNFILRDDFNGLQIRGNTGVAEAGYGGNQFVSALGGMNFNDDRGNVTVQGEYSKSKRVFYSDVPHLRQVNGFVAVDADSTGLPQGSDGFPDNVFLRDIRQPLTNRFGVVGIPQQNGSGACGTGTLANNGAPNTAGTAYTCSFLFTPDGRLTPLTGTRVGTGPGGSVIGGNGQTGREDNQGSLFPRNERYNINLLAHYEFSPAFDLFFEGKYSRIKTVGNNAGPTFLNNTTASLGNDARLNPRLDNPFLNAADRATIASGYLANNCTFPLGTSIGAVSCVNNTPGQAGATPAQEATRAAALAARNLAIANGTYRFLFARTLTDLGPRDEHFDRETYRFVGGVRGDFNDDWHYEFSANYGKFKETDELTGYVNRQRFLLSLDAGRNPVTGAIQCRSQFDPAAATGLPNFTGSALATDIAACVPYNAFGAPNNQAAISYFSYVAHNRSSIDQLDFQGFVSGDSSQLFSLPGGPVRFVVGGEYRREKAFNDSDDAADNGISNGVFLGDAAPGATKVKEAFGELQFPILRDTPFFEELTVSGAGRISDYNSAVGTVYTYNGGAEWAPIRDIRLRANYARAVRAPNVSENGFPNVNNFANSFVDPCNVNAIGNNPNRGTNCTTQLSAIQRANIAPAGYSLGVISGSNPDLIEESSDSYTLGAVITPRFLPGFSFSADYFDIKVKNVIVALSAQQIVDACYDSAALSSPLCATFSRNLTGGAGPAGELPGQILNYTVVQGPQNFASRVRRGLDIEAAYRTNLTDNIRLDTRLNLSHIFQNSNFEDATNPNLENRVLTEVGDPKNEFRWLVDVGFGPLTVGYTMRYISPQLVLGPTAATTYENLNPLNGQPPLNADVFDIPYYPSVLYHSIRFDFKVSGEGDGDGFNFFAGVDNLTNRIPPLGASAATSSSGIFNARGRNFFAGFRGKF